MTCVIIIINRNRFLAALGMTKSNTRQQGAEEAAAVRDFSLRLERACAAASSAFFPLTVRIPVIPSAARNLVQIENQNKNH